MTLFLVSLGLALLTILCLVVLKLACDIHRFNLGIAYGKKEIVEGQKKIDWCDYNLKRLNNFFDSRREQGLSEEKICRQWESENQYIKI